MLTADVSFANQHKDYPVCHKHHDWQAHVGNCELCESHTVTVQSCKHIIYIAEQHNDQVMGMCYWYQTQRLVIWEVRAHDHPFNTTESKRTALWLGRVLSSSVEYILKLHLYWSMAGFSQILFMCDVKALFMLRWLRLMYLSIALV